MNLYQVAEEIARRLASIFLQGQGRPAAGLRRHARSSRTTRTGAICLLFYEYFHGDNGAGLGASHQTGWTGVIARLHAPVRDDHRRSRCSSSARAPRSSKSTEPRARRRRGAARSRSDAEARHGTTALSVALPDQHARLADRAVARRWAGRPRSTTSPTPSSTAWPRWASTGSGS